MSPLPFELGELARTRQLDGAGQLRQGAGVVGETLLPADVVVGHGPSSIPRGSDDSNAVDSR